jgi:hypothetical protein
MTCGSYSFTGFAKSFSHKIEGWQGGRDWFMVHFWYLFLPVSAKYINTHA